MSFFSSSDFPKIQKPVSIAIVRSDFNEDIVEELFQDALHGFKKCGVPMESIEEFRVPGALEIPQVVSRLKRSDEFDGILTLGVVIKGDTPHFEYVCENVTRGIMDISLMSNVPIIFGVLTVLNTQQAEIRISKGREFASSLIKMMMLFEGKM
ncbi:MAG: 6,7-dimethyl-8-ribityllumazine synthase [Candidatus Peregrinibacteria bacterium]